MIWLITLMLLYPLIVLLVYAVARACGRCPPILAQYTRNVWVSLDQFINALLLGDEDETISSRAGKAARNGHPFAARVIDALVFVCTGQRGHCASCIENDEGVNAL